MVKKEVSKWDTARTAVGVMALFVALVGGILILQNKINEKVVDLRDLPETVADNVHINGVDIDQGEVALRYFENENSEKLLIYFHGIGNPDTARPTAASKFVNVIAPIYDTGSIVPIPFNDQELYDVVDASISEARKLGFNDEDVSILGFSLGSAQAVYAAKNYPDLHIVILVGAFTSFKDACVELAGASTCSLIPDDYLLSESIAGEAVSPIHQYHSIDDKVIIIDDGRRLFSYLGSDDKEFTELTGEHNSFDILKMINENL